MRNRSMQMERVFGDATHPFEEKGYEVIEGFLDPMEVEHLLDFYRRHPLPGGRGFHASSHSPDPDYKRRIHAEVRSIVFPKASVRIRGVRPVTSSYTVKEPGPESFFDFHLDWSMVDEHHHRSLTIWIPLTNTHEGNGRISVLESSHALGHTYRAGPGLYLFAEDASVWSKRFVRRDLDMAAGDALIYDHRIFHGSLPNMGEKPRIALNHVLLPSEVDSYHYTMCGDRELVVHHVDDDFYNRYAIGTMPDDVEEVDRIRLPHPHVTQDVVNRLQR